jgi:hypothetical protein
MAKFGKPAFIFAPNPQQQVNDKGQLYDYIRPLATIEPMAIQLGLPVNTQFGFREIKRLQHELTQARYQDALVFVAWEHALLAQVAKRLVVQGGGDPSAVPEWGDDDFDSIYIVKLTRLKGRLAVSFTRDREGLDNSPEFNPGERIWQHTRRHGTRNRYFIEQEILGALARALARLGRSSLNSWLTAVILPRQMSPLFLRWRIACTISGATARDRIEGGPGAGDGGWPAAALEHP